MNTSFLSKTGNRKDGQSCSSEVEPEPDGINRPHSKPSSTKLQKFCRKSKKTFALMKDQIFI